MALLARVLSDRVPYILKAEKAHQESLPDEERKSYRPTEFLLEPPTASESARLQDQLLAGLAYQGSLEIVSRRLVAILGVRTSAEDPPRDIERGPGVDLLSYLRTSWILELGGALADLADPDDEDFG